MKRDGAEIESESEVKTVEAEADDSEYVQLKRRFEALMDDHKKVQETPLDNMEKDLESLKSSNVMSEMDRS